jgi:hypothetical protein
MDSEKVKEVRVAYQAASADSFLTFVRGLTIPSSTGPVLFDDVMAPFQRECFEDLAPSLPAIKDGRMPPRRRYWIERTKKSSKDCDVSACLIWLMAFSDRPLLGQVCAANSEQARIIEDRAAAFLHYNSWLNIHVEILQRMIRSRKLPREIRTQIEATGSAGAAQGPTPDILILNELVHVERWSVMEAHMNNADGVPQGVAVVATNAGIRGSKAEVWRKNAFANRARWSVHVWSKLAPWISREDMEDAKRRDPIGAEFARLWKGRWISGVGDAVDEDSIDRAFRVDGPLEGPEPGWRYLAGLDLGVSHDHAGVAVLGVHEGEQRLRVARIAAWEPSVPNDKGILEVDCDAVEAECKHLTRLFRIEWFGYDPAAGGSFMAQRLRKINVPMREMTFASMTNQTAMATSFVKAMKDGRLECYEDDEGRLRRDFGKFTIVHRPPSKYKLEAVSDEFGHADVGVALIIPLPRAIEMLGGVSGLRLTDSVAFDDEGDLSDEELEAMPDALRDIYDAEVEDEEDFRSRGWERLDYI